MDHYDPAFGPGEGTHYSDTAYVLLGQTIEGITGESLAASYRTLLDFDELGLDATHLETAEAVPPTAGPMAEQYLVEHAASGIDASTDLYGGGGLVSSTTDIATFYAALADGSIFDDPATFDSMLSNVATGPAADSSVRSGIFAETIRGHACFGHTGFWGAMVTVCPDLDLVVARGFGQVDTPGGWRENSLVERVIDELDAMS